MPARDLPRRGKTEEGERGTIRLRMVGSIWPVVAEIDEARLVGMECKSLPCKTLPEYVENPFGIEEILERHHGIIGKPDKGTSPLETWPHLKLKPFIQHVMQKNVERQGEITPPCGEPSVAWRRRPLSRTPAFNHLSIIRRITQSGLAGQESFEDESVESNRNILRCRYQAPTAVLNS